MFGIKQKIYFIDWLQSITDRYPIEFMIMSFWHENYYTHVIKISHLLTNYFMRSGATREDIW